MILTFSVILSQQGRGFHQLMNTMMAESNKWIKTMFSVTKYYGLHSLNQGFSNCGTRKVVRWYAIKFIKILNLRVRRSCGRRTKKRKHDPFYLSFGFTYIVNHRILFHSVLYYETLSKMLGYDLGGPGSIPSGTGVEKIFLHSFMSRLVLGFT